MNPWSRVANLVYFFTALCCGIFFMLLAVQVNQGPASGFIGTIGFLSLAFAGFLAAEDFNRRE